MRGIQSLLRNPYFRFAMKKDPEVLSGECPKSFFDIKMNDIDGQLIDFSTLKGSKAYLCVNVASKWGLTKRDYEQLVAMDNDLRDKGLRIMGFPCNQFGAQ